MEKIWKKQARRKGTPQVLLTSNEQPQDVSEINTLEPFLGVPLGKRPTPFIVPCSYPAAGKAEAGHSSSYSPLPPGMGVRTKHTTGTYSLNPQAKEELPLRRVAVKGKHPTAASTRGSRQTWNPDSKPE